MELIFSDWVYLITNVFGTYVIFKFFTIFYPRENINKLLEILSFISYYVIISALYIITKTPLIMIISNLILFLALSYNYKASFKKRILSTALIYIILSSVDIIVAILTGYVGFSIVERVQMDSFNFITVNIVAYGVVLILSRHKNIKGNKIVHKRYWLLIIIIPLASIYLILMLLSSKNFSPLSLLTGITTVLAINFIVLFLYDNISQTLTESIEQIKITEQNHYYKNQLGIMESSLKETNKIKHDVKNHLMAINGLINSGKNHEAQTYLKEMLDLWGDEVEFSQTGNVVVDSILNYKLREMKLLGADISLDVNIPSKISVNCLDIAAVLGNLLDNVIEAFKKAKENLWVFVKIRYTKGRLIIEIRNSFDGVVNKNNKKIDTRKKNKEEHGVGLKNVSNIVKNYNGIIDIGYNNKIFSVVVMLYVD
ncbi:GHKL domain-containing protein [Proteinivorax tanatarense]|uniref:GHKL domain-containing protein n=1 Tax=Proteinivorax tanatarense TaxID=1260629 RepID=A0AAU7VQA7_9FIRM